MRRPACFWALLFVVVLVSGCDVFTSAEVRLERAATQFQQGEYRAAEIELKRLLRKDPDHAQARLLLGRSEYMLGDLGTAERDLKRALGAGAAKGDVDPWLARIYLATGRPDAVLAESSSGELSLPDDLRVILTGQAHLAMRDTAAATEAFRQALEFPEVATDARIGLAECRALSGGLQPALESLAAITESDPSRADAWLAQGRLFLQSGRPAEADRAFARATEHATPRLTEAERLQAMAGRMESQLAQGQMEAASRTLATLSERSPGSPVTRLLSARLELAQGNLGEAGRLLQSVATSLPDEPGVSFLLGSVLLAQGNLNQAERTLAGVVSKTPENLEARKLLAETRLRMNRPEAAIAVLTPALQGQVTDPGAEALLAAAQVEAGVDPSAMEMLRASIERNPGDIASRLQLASLYLSNRQPEEAAELLRATASPANDRRRDALLVRAIFESRGEEAAQAELERMLRQRPEDVEMLNVAADHYLSLREFDAATAVLDKALALRPGDTGALLRTAQVRLALGNLDGAEASLRRVLSHEGDNVLARVAMAEIASRRGRSDEAKRWLEEVRVTSSQAIGSRLMLARLYFADGETARGDQMLEDVLKSTPGRADVLSAVGALDLDLGRAESALRRYRQAADLEPDRDEHWLGMARAQVALGYDVAARESLEKALVVDPTSERAVGHMVLFELRAGQRQEALQRVLQLRERLPRSATAASLEGDVRTALGQHDEAAAAYRAAAMLQPRLFAVVREAQARQRAGSPDPAGPLEAWLRSHPDDVAARSVYALILDASGDKGRAVREYERVVAAGRASAVIANNLAWLYFEAGDPRAESLARQARELGPDNPAIADTLGWILLNKGMAEEAVALLEEGANGSPHSLQIQLHYAEALAAVGRRSDAVTLVRRLLEGEAATSGRAEAEALLARLTG